MILSLLAALPTRYGHVEFYSVAAQVMPVLLIALVFEQRLFEREGLTALARLALTTSVGGLFVLSEGVAFHVLYVGYAHRQDQDWVIFPLLAGALLMLLPLALQPLFELDREEHNVQFWIGVVFFSAVAGVIGTGLTVLLFHY